jgi:hypothetical protein
MVSGGSLYTASSANAASCNSRSALCLYEHAGYTGRVIAFTGRATNLAEQDFDKKATSAANRTSQTWCLYSETNLRGASLRLRGGEFGEAPRNLGDSGWNDRARSVAPC